MEKAQIKLKINKTTGVPSYTLTFNNLTQGEIYALHNALNDSNSHVAEDVHCYMINAAERAGVKCSST